MSTRQLGVHAEPRWIARDWLWLQAIRAVRPQKVEEETTTTFGEETQTESTDQVDHLRPI